MSYDCHSPLRSTLDLIETRKPAERLLTAMERKGEQNPRFGNLYRTFMQEYEDLQHMEIVSPPCHEDGQSRCYLPHHGVFKESSSTTKLRVVFNESQRTKAGDSLNAHLHVGSNFLPALSDILLRWQWHRFVFIATSRRYTGR